MLIIYELELTHPLLGDLQSPWGQLTSGASHFLPAEVTGAALLSQTPFFMSKDAKVLCHHKAMGGGNSSRSPDRGNGVSYILEGKH